MNLRKIIGNRIARPLALRYVRKTRTVRKYGLEIRVSPGVFHPTLYHSTRFLIEFLSGKAASQEGKRIRPDEQMLEIGAGSGMISLWAAKQGAEVTATDISSLAIEDIYHNASRNDLPLNIYESDLFQGLPETRYDLIVINPPYYPADPTEAAEHAWYCGAEFQYFQRLFAGLSKQLKEKGKIYMVLSEDCELTRIRKIGQENGWKMREVAKKKVWFEWNYIYSIEQS